MRSESSGRTLTAAEGRDQSPSPNQRFLTLPEKRADWSYEDARWLEVAPPGAATSIAIVPPRGGMWEQVGIDSRVSLISADLEASHQSLKQAGVDVDAEILRLGPGVPGMFFLRDPDGNTLQIVEA